MDAPAHLFDESVPESGYSEFPIGHRSGLYDELVLSLITGLVLIAGGSDLSTAELYDPRLARPAVMDPKDGGVA